MVKHYRTLLHQVLFLLSLHGQALHQGHEYLNGQLARRGIEFEALDNGLLRCADPAAAQRIARRLSMKRRSRDTAFLS